MTDKQQWEEFLANFNIPSLYHVYDATDELVVSAKRAETVKGYTGFELVIVFNKEGQFKNIGIYG